jgi:hypothetical protein
MAFTVYKNSKYEMVIRRGAEALAGWRHADAAAEGATALPPAEGAESVVDGLLDDSAFGLADAGTVTAAAYSPNLFLEAIGPPYISSGGGPFGTFVRGGGSLLFSDLLGERKVSLYAQVGNRLRDLAVGARYLNRERRWNWGASAEVQPSFRRLPRLQLTEFGGEPAVARETHYFERTQLRLAGHLLYPMSQVQRVEFDAGVRHIRYRRSVQSTIRSIESGRVLNRGTEHPFGGDPATVGEVTTAFVHDTAVFGPTSPVLGGRSRFELTSTFGELSVVRMMLDHRRYFMPVKPYTLAARVVHLGQYGPHADDPRLLPAFLGSRQFVRGYGWGSLRCELAANDACNAYEDLLGSRLLVGNVELRAPVMGMLSRDLRYGPVPAEAFLFADSGLIWSRAEAFAAGSPTRSVVSSFGAGARLNAFGLPLEIAVVRALDAPARGWSFDFSFRHGF